MPSKLLALSRMTTQGSGNSSIISVDQGLELKCLLKRFSTDDLLYSKLSFLMERIILPGGNAYYYNVMKTVLNYLKGCMIIGDELKE